MVWFAPLKKAVTDQQGHLMLAYWQGNDAAKGKPIDIDLSLSIPVYPAKDNPDGSRFPWEFAVKPKVNRSCIEVDGRYSGGLILLEGHFDTENGIILEGVFKVHNPEKGWSSIGVYIEEDINMNGLTQGTAILMETRGCTEIGVFRNSRSNRRRSTGE